MSAEAFIVPLADVSPEAVALAGGKGCNLSALASNGFPVPPTLVVTAPAYRRFIAANDLEERILLELNRKAFADMRWEEIWDAALRIRNLFLRASWPTDLKGALQSVLVPGLADGATVIRSSATSEDSAGASFAGLHESYVNVRGLAAILEHLRKVWASLWSDAALLYRQELGLTPARSDMAVLIQELVMGDASGVAFSVNPLDADQCVIEAVPGLNQGLVDGMITPDRWILARGSGTVIDFTAGEGHEAVFPVEQGVALRPAPARRSGEACLADDDVQRLFGDVRKIEACLGCPQDVEWTVGQGRFTFLQTRPVTATADGGRDQRGWYLSLRRSYDNLCRLRTRIEDDLIPHMIQVARELAQDDLDHLADEALAAEIERRAGINHHWSNVYYADFIPFAHGVRLFGQVYNDALKPEDPYAFVDLLTDTPMESLARNRRLEELAAMVRDDPELATRLRDEHRPPAPGPFRAMLDEFLSIYGDLSSAVTGDRERAVNHGPLIHLVLELAAASPSAERRLASDARRAEDFFL
ncbi:MAG: PEP/pyruvate-binding domain-containing protein, partial [Desulfobacterales bacterium]